MRMFVMALTYAERTELLDALGAQPLAVDNCSNPLPNGDEIRAFVNQDNRLYSRIDAVEAFRNRTGSSLKQAINALKTVVGEPLYD